MLFRSVDYLNARGEKVGVVEVHLYRPFSPKYFFRVLPSTVETIAVLDRCKEPGSLGEPLYEDVRTLFFDKGGSAPKIVGGRYGLGSKDTTPSHIKTVFDNLKAKIYFGNQILTILSEVLMIASLLMKLPEKPLIYSKTMNGEN